MWKWVFIYCGVIAMVFKLGYDIGHRAGAVDVAAGDYTCEATITSQDIKWKCKEVK